MSQSFSDDVSTARSLYDKQGCRKLQRIFVE